MYRGLADRVYQLPFDEYTKDSDSERSLEPLHPDIKRDDKSPNGIISLVKKEDRKEFVYNNLPDKPEGWRVEVPSSEDRVSSCRGWQVEVPSSEDRLFTTTFLISFVRSPILT